VKPGQCVAILGATGAGKSVLMSLIPRFFDPTAGRVLIDGVDARQLNLDDLRRNIGLVFQESFLFSNTVARTSPSATPRRRSAQIERRRQIAAAHDFIMALPKGYDTVLGESGNSLSGGQRQRLAIARAVLLEPAILLLDDPTAAIDSETEHEIFEALDRAIAGRTTFIVAHRLSTLRRADFIIVMEDGRIVQRGTHEELMKRARTLSARRGPAAGGRPRACSSCRLGREDRAMKRRFPRKSATLGLVRRRWATTRMRSSSSRSSGG
jgi:ABC-type multidrug transport system fused ATPase/permease subunit